jgi:hypothetical protein
MSIITSANLANAIVKLVAADALLCFAGGENSADVPLGLSSHSGGTKRGR